MNALISELKQVTQQQIILFVMTISLCATWFWITQEHGWGGNKSLEASYIFTTMSHLDHIGPNHNPNITSGHYWDAVIPVWRERIGSLWVAGNYLRLLNPGSIEEFNFAIGFYQLFWFVATLSVLWFSKLYDIKVLFLIFIGLIFSLTPDPSMYPWDLPSMFMWTLSYVLWSKGKYHWMMAAIIFGTLFKETVAVTAFLLLFTYEIPLWKRIRNFSIVFLGCLVVRLLVTKYCFGHFVILCVQEEGIPNIDHWKSVVDFFTYPMNYTLIFFGGGTFFLAAVLPIDKRIKILLGIFVFCLTLEPCLCDDHYGPRQFSDIIPILAIQLRNLI